MPLDFGFHNTEQIKKRRSPHIRESPLKYPLTAEQAPTSEKAFLTSLHRSHRFASSPLSRNVTLGHPTLRAPTEAPRKA